METLDTGVAAAKVIGLPGTCNFRSTAGYRAHGGVIRDGALFRSDALHKLDADAIEQLRAMGVTRVLDLRDFAELGLEPSALTGSTIELMHLPIFGEGGLAAIGGFALDPVYRFVIEHRADALTEAVRLIAEAPAGGVVVHCTAGKDRTGLVIATALSAVGVSREQIIADYATSGDNIAGERADLILTIATERFGELDEPARELMVGSPAAAIAAALDIMDACYGSAESMLRQHGFGDESLEALRLRLVA